MRVWSVVGFRKVNYQSKKTGRQVEGHTIYLSSPPADVDVTGQECKEVYISKQACTYIPAVGDRVHVFYNDRGYIDEVVKVKNV